MTGGCEGVVLSGLRQSLCAGRLDRRRRGVPVKCPLLKPEEPTQKDRTATVRPKSAYAYQTKALCHRVIPALPAHYWLNSAYPASRLPPLRIVWVYCPGSPYFQP